MASAAAPAPVSASAPVPVGWVGTKPIFPWNKSKMEAWETALMTTEPLHPPIGWKVSPHKSLPGKFFYAPQWTGEQFTAIRKDFQARSKAARKATPKKSG